MLSSLYDIDLVFVFTLTENAEISQTFSNGKRTKECRNLRMTAVIDGNPPPVGFSADLTVFGMDNDDMSLIVATNRKSISGVVVEIYASDSINSPTTVFYGSILNSKINYNDMPNVSISMTAFSSAPLNALRYPITSYKEPVQAQNLLEAFATYGGMGFENNGVDQTLTKVYLDGTLGSNIHNICTASNIKYVVENNRLSIWDGKRNLPIPIINVATGLVGYPTPSVLSIDFATYFNPNIRYGGQVYLESEISQCTGLFGVVQVSHRLASQTPSGEWFTFVHAFYDLSVLDRGVK